MTSSQHGRPEDGLGLVRVLRSNHEREIYESAFPVDFSALTWLSCLQDSRIS
jgi:hypothetical protein